MRPLIEDVESRNKIRKASLVPLTIATSALVEMGRQASTSALLSALNKLPKVWRMQAESELNTENNEVDLVLEDELKESLEDCDEHAEMSFLHELVADFEPYAHIEADDEKCPSLHPISAQLAKQLKEYHSFRTANLNRLRTGTKVVDITFEHEKQVRARRVTRIRLLLAVFSLQSLCMQTLLRFLGWCKSIHGIENPTMAVLQSADVGRTVEAYAQWLEGRQLAWSSMTNYLSGLINAAQFACCELEEVPDLSQLANLRSQTDKMAREANLYKRKSENW